jgi:hypothetical protein
MKVGQIAKEVLKFLESQYGRNTFDFKFNASYNIDGDVEIWLNVCAKNGKVLKVITNDFLRYIFNITPMEYIEERKMWLWQKELIDEIEGS